jgi:hypothetical protein
MAYIVPKNEMKFEDLLKAREASINLLTSLIKERGKSPNGYVIRDILPKTDLGLANEEWKISYTSAYTWETKIDKTLEDDKFIVLYGYHSNSAVPKTTAIKFFVDVRPIEVIEVENLYTYMEPIGFFTPLGWSEGEVLRIDFFGNSTGDDYVVLRGFVAERKSKTIV